MTARTPYAKPADFQPSPVGDAKIAGDMVSDRLPDGAGRYAVPLRSPIERDEMYTSPAPNAPMSREMLTADPRLSQLMPARIVGNNVSGMPDGSRSTTLATEGPIEAPKDSRTSLPHRTNESETIT